MTRDYSDFDIGVFVSTIKHPFFLLILPKGPDTTVIDGCYVYNPWPSFIAMPEKLVFNNLV